MDQLCVISLSWDLIKIIITSAVTIVDVTNQMKNFKRKLVNFIHKGCNI